MASNGQCAGLTNAIRGKGITYAQLAQRIGSTEQRVSDICSGKQSATQKEFNDLAAALGMTNLGPHAK
ncbi:hypothetical protein BJV78DRAFT_923634 [Lactifluus subvellereus]|nr:hypothetical protein BJV78DRAFT_923634 [Lactifluus subvellereus]